MKSPKEQCEDLSHRHRKIWRSRALDKLETVRWKQISTSWGPIRAKHLLPVDTGEACPVCHKSTWLSGQRGSRSSCPTWPLSDWSDWPLDFFLISHSAYIFPGSSDSDTDSWHAASTKPSYEEIICPYPPTTVWKDFFVHFVLLVSSHQCYWCSGSYWIWGLVLPKMIFTISMDNTGSLSVLLHLLQFSGYLQNIFHNTIFLSETEFKPLNNVSNQ